MKVLHGTGRPRLVYRTTGILTLGEIEQVYDGYIKLSGTQNFSIDLINTAIYSTNPNGEDTWARITNVDVANKLIYHTTFNNIFPESGATAYSKYVVYDLPYCQNNLIEGFSPEFITHKLAIGKIETEIKGWWYYVVLDYSRRLSGIEAGYFQRLFDKSRDYGVYLYPRADNSSIYYPVELSPESILQMAQKPFHSAHKLFKVLLNGTTRLDSVPLTLSGGYLITEGGDFIVTEDDDNIGV